MSRDCVYVSAYLVELDRAGCGGRHQASCHGEWLQVSRLVPYLPVCIDLMEESFSEDRVRTALDRLIKSRERATQVRIDSFFKPNGDSTSTEPSATKRQKLSGPANSKGKSPKVLAKGVGKWKK